MFAHTKAVLFADIDTRGVVPNDVPNVIRVPAVHAPVAAVMLWLPLSKWVAVPVDALLL